MDCTVWIGAASRSAGMPAGWSSSTSTLLSASLTLVLLAPALAWAAWRQRRQVPVHRLSWTWDLAGAILGTLLLLGPLQTIQGLHPAAPVSLALGAGIRCRRWLVWRSAAWQRTACRLGILVAGILPFYALWQWHSVASVPERVWSQPGARTPNVLWIVADTLRADHMSVYGYDRPTTPELEKWAKQGITFEMARSAAPWTLPSHVTMFTGLWPSQHGARRPSLFRSVAHRRRAPARQGLCHRRHCRQCEDLQPRLWRGARVRHLCRLSL